MLRALVNAVMPQRCVFCGELSRDNEQFICDGCREDLSRADPAPPTAPLEAEVAPLAYAFPVDAAIKALKFRRKLFYVPALAGVLRDALIDLPDDIDAVLPVPLHWRRQWFRGFNQAIEIGRPVACQLGVPVINNVIRKRATPYQSGLDSDDRAKNLRAAFVVRDSLSHTHVLIVDDVITTGATVGELARVLRQAGVERVSALAVARATGK